MNMLASLNSPAMYLICGSIVLFVVIVCIIFMVRAYKAGKAIGMDVTKMKRTITASATFAVLPSIGILLGVIALSGSLGTPLPWLRLSVIGALHYETQVAEAAAEAAGLTALSASQMTPTAFTTIALLMTFCIMWGMVFSIFSCKKYCDKLSGKSAEKKHIDDISSVSAEMDGNPDAAAGNGTTQQNAKSHPEYKSEKGLKKSKKMLNLSGFGDIAMTAMFIGLVSAYIGSYIGGFVSGGGLFSFGGDILPIIVAVVGGAAMAVFIFIKDKFNAEWVDGFSIAGSMLIAMASAVVFAGI